MSQEFIAMLDYMEKERGIKRELLLDAVQTALLAAARKSFGPARDMTVALDPKTAKITAIAHLLVVEKVTQPHDEISLPKARLIKPDAVIGDTVEVGRGRCVNVVSDAQCGPRGRGSLRHERSGEASVPRIRRAIGNRTRDSRTRRDHRTFSP